MKRYVLRRNTLVDRETGLHWYIPDELKSVLDARQIDWAPTWSLQDKRFGIRTIHDLPPNLRASAKVKGAPGQGYFLV